MINVDQDALCRNQRTLEALLPRQSNSKFTDAALMPTLSWPCFAVNLTSEKAHESMERITGHLERQHGLIRFHKDGFGTHIEDRTRCHYLPAELKKFDGIESEWPVFFAFLLIDAKFRGNEQLAKEYRAKLEATLGDDKICPTYYQVTSEDKEPVYLSNMHWVQAVACLAQMLGDNLIEPDELDPRRLFEKSKKVERAAAIEERTIHVTLISENASLQRFLSSYGVVSETPAQTEPIVIWPSQDLVKVYATMGYDKRLGLTGRPRRPIGVLGSSRVYRILGRTVVAYPLVFDVSDFYISSDTDSLIDNVWFSLDFLKKYFDRGANQPLFLFILREDLCRGPRLSLGLTLSENFKKRWRSNHETNFVP